MGHCHSIHGPDSRFNDGDGNDDDDDDYDEDDDFDERSPLPSSRTWTTHPSKRST